MASELEDLFESQLRTNGLTDFVKEFKAIPGRKFRFDFAFLKKKLLIEIQGGIWVRGKHGRGSGIYRDHEKLNLAAKHGWYVLQFDTKAISNKTAIAITKEILEKE
jgi:very-short-patch-repair endonuclease